MLCAVFSGLINLSLTFALPYFCRSWGDVVCHDSTLGLADDVQPEQRYMQYMQVLITDIAVVHSFLAEIDPAFVICHRFDKAGEVEQSHLIADFLAPNADIARLLNHSLVEVARPHGTSTAALPYDGSDVIAARLQRKFNALESTVCNENGMA